MLFCDKVVVDDETDVAEDSLRTYPDFFKSQ
jgi:hypothetical protein